MPLGSLGADVGCGNGKYLGVNPQICVFGSDYSLPLIKICQERGFDTLVADGLSLPYRSSAFVTFARSFAGFCHLHCCHSSFFYTRETIGCSRGNCFCIKIRNS